MRHIPFYDVCWDDWNVLWMDDSNMILRCNRDKEQKIIFILVLEIFEVVLIDNKFGVLNLI